MTTKVDPATVIAGAIRECLISLRESDANGDTTNVADGLFEIGLGMFAIAKALEDLREHGLHLSLNNPDFESFSVSLHDAPEKTK